LSAIISTSSLTKETWKRRKAFSMGDEQSEGNKGNRRLLKSTKGNDSRDLQRELVAVRRKEMSRRPSQELEKKKCITNSRRSSDGGIRILSHGFWQTDHSATKQEIK
jgi:hypothetical protein